METETILRLWSTKEKTGQDEAVNIFKQKFQNIEVNVENKELSSLLLTAFNNGAQDFITAASATVKHHIYASMFDEIGSTGNIEMMEKLFNFMKSTIPNLHEKYYQQFIALSLQKRNFYGNKFVTSLQSILDGSVETIGHINNTDNVIQYNEYCERVRGIIQFDHSGWHLLNKKNWTNEMYNYFYFSACQVKNIVVLNSIES